MSILMSAFHKPDSVLSRAPILFPLNHHNNPMRYVLSEVQVRLCHSRGLKPSSGFPFCYEQYLDSLLWPRRPYVI